MKYFYKQNDKLNKLVDLYFQNISFFNNKYYRGELSVILLGSLSRGEGSWYEENGNCRLLSDIEFFTIYPAGFKDFDKYENFVKACAKEVFGNQGILFHVDNTFILCSKLKKLERKLIIFDANNFGINIVGKNVINLLPKVSLNNINFYDIYDILAHRLFSVLYYGMPLKESKKLKEYQYNLAKNSLDLLTVLLANQNILVSGFINKVNALDMCNIDIKYKEYFKLCLDIKLGNDDLSHKFPISEMEEIFLEIVHSLNIEFKIPLKNTLVNFNMVVKRTLGIIKRGLKSKKIFLSQKRHINNMIDIFESKKNITKSIIERNYVLNGYPAIKCKQRGDTI